MSISNGRPERKDETERIELLKKQLEERDRKAIAEGRPPLAISSSFAAHKRELTGS